jgi:hypothetical protein
MYILFLTGGKEAEEEEERREAVLRRPRSRDERAGASPEVPGRLE